MPVMVVPADTTLGLPLVEALAEVGGQVRAYASGEGDIPALRAAGAFVAVGDLDDEGKLDAAMAQVHTVISLHADPLVPSADGLAAQLDATITAASHAEVSRLVVRSVPGAPTGTDPLRRVLAEVESRLQSLPLPTVAVRTSLVDVDEVRDAVVSRAGEVADRSVAVDPIDAATVMAALVALDDARGSMVGHATFRLQGPERTLQEWLDELGGDLVGRRWVPAGDHPLLVSSLASPWREPADGRTADLLAFAE